MDQSNQLFAVVLAEPDNRDARLVFADWCESVGDPRADFIRVQLALERMDKSHPWWRDFKRDEYSLLARHRKIWDAPVYRVLNRTEFKSQVRSRRSSFRGWKYAGGFIDTLRIDTQALLERHELLFGLGPIRGLRLFEPRGRISQLLRLPEIVRVRSLDLTGASLNEKEVKQLAEAEVLRDLRVLNLAGCRLTQADCEILVESRVFSDRLRLIVSRNPFGDEGKELLLRRFGNLVRHENGDPFLNVEKVAGKDGWVSQREQASFETRLESYDDETLYDGGVAYREIVDRDEDESLYEDYLTGGFGSEIVTPTDKNDPDYDEGLVSEEEDGFGCTEPFEDNDEEYYQ